MSLPPIRRKIRQLAGKKNASLASILNSTSDGDQILSVEAVSGEVHNTRMTLRVDHAYAQQFSGSVHERYSNRVCLYNRLKLEDIFALDFSRDLNNRFNLNQGEVKDHPLSQSDVRKLLNGQHQYDFEEEDVSISYIDGNSYVITAKPTSLGYVGVVSVTIGNEVIIIDERIPTEQALSSNTGLIEGALATLNSQPINLGDDSLIGTLGAVYHQFTADGFTPVDYFLNISDSAEHVYLITYPNNAASIPSSNVNETVDLINSVLRFRVVPFTKNNIPPSTQPVSLGSIVSIQTWLPALSAVEKVFSVWVDGVLTSFAQLVAGAIEGLTVAYTAGTGLSFANTTYNERRVQLKANTPSLFSDLNPLWRLANVAGNENSAANVFEFEREVIDITLSALPAIELIPSVIEPYAFTSQVDFVTLANKLGFTGSNYTRYLASNLTQEKREDGSFRLSANTDAEIDPSNFMVAYRIKAVDLTIIQSLPLETSLGVMTLSTLDKNLNATPVSSINITPNWLFAHGTTIGGELIFGRIISLPHLNNRVSFDVDFDAGQGVYKPTLNHIDEVVAWLKPSIITPINADAQAVNDLNAQSGINLVAIRSDESLTFSIDTTSDPVTGVIHDVTYDVALFNDSVNLNVSEEDTPPAVLVLLKVAPDAFDRIADLAINRPNDVILTIVDGSNSTPVTALQVVEDIYQRNNEFYFWFHAEFNVDYSIHYNKDWDGGELLYKYTPTTINLHFEVDVTPVIDTRIRLVDPFAGDTNLFAKLETSLAQFDPVLNLLPGFFERIQATFVEQPDSVDDDITYLKERAVTYTLTREINDDVEASYDLPVIVQLDSTMVNLINSMTAEQLSESILGTETVSYAVLKNRMVSDGIHSFALLPDVSMVPGQALTLTGVENWLLQIPVGMKAKAKAFDNTADMFHLNYGPLPEVPWVKIVPQDAALFVSEATPPAGVSTHYQITDPVSLTQLQADYTFYPEPDSAFAYFFVGLPQHIVNGHYTDMPEVVIRGQVTDRDGDISSNVLSIPLSDFLSEYSYTHEGWVYLGVNLATCDFSLADEQGVYPVTPLQWLAGVHFDRLIGNFNTMQISDGPRFTYNLSTVYALKTTFPAVVPQADYVRFTVDTEEQGSQVTLTSGDTPLVLELSNFDNASDQNDDLYVQVISNYYPQEEG